MIDVKKKPVTSCNTESIVKNKPLLKHMLETMLLINKIEVEIDRLFNEGKAYGTTHLCIGEEAATAGATLALKKEDYIFLSHRGHGQTIGKGSDVNGFMAEMLGKATGLNGGKGGSMHIADVGNGVMGSNGVLGATNPLACGAAITIKYKKLDRVSAVFFGDGASNQGAVHESMNLASAWKLPVIFCINNNKYGMSTPFETVVGETDLKKRAAAYGMQAMECDGNDIIEVYKTMCHAREIARSNEPVMVVLNTYRTSGHSKSDKNLYRTEEEIAYWEKRGPISRFRDFLLKNKLMTLEEIFDINKKAEKKTKEALEYALASPEPEPEQAMTNIYS